MTPLIDVVFLLLTFFILSLVLMVRAEVIGIELPDVPGSVTASNPDIITIALEADGTIRVNGEIASKEDLPDLLAAARAHLPDASVIVAADESSRSGDFIRLQQMLTEAGFSSVSILTAPTPADSTKRP